MVMGSSNGYDESSDSDTIIYTANTTGRKKHFRKTKQYKHNITTQFANININNANAKHITKLKTKKCPIK